jgi:hypothetical protein
MFNAIEGIFRNGKIEFLEPPPQAEETRVLVTFLSDPSKTDIAARRINKTEAAELRARFGAIVEDWDSPEMDIYDDA